MTISLPTFMEDTVARAVDEWFRRYDEAEKSIDRVPWTREMTKREQFEMAMGYHMAGPNGWAQFLQQGLASGMTYEQAIREMTTLALWFKKELAKDGIDPPPVMPEMDMMPDMGMMPEMEMMDATSAYGI